jgi:hypothetical protein
MGVAFIGRMIDYHTLLYNAVSTLGYTVSNDWMISE